MTLLFLATLALGYAWAGGLGRLWGPLLTIPIYQAFNALGWIRWTREQRLPAAGAFA